MSHFEFKIQIMWESIPLLLNGAKLTIFITIVGLFFGFILGTSAGLFKISRHFILRKIAGAYIESIRGTPLMVQVMFLYFGLPLLLGVRIPPLIAGITAIAFNSGAYIAEVVRGAIQSISKGQQEAGRSIGLTRFQAMRYVIWPQAFKRMIPPLGNQFIISLKDTSLLVVIGVAELTRQGTEIVADTFRAFEVWLTVALVYLAMTLTLSKLLRILEKRLLINGQSI
jgi:glutamine transport system permease protein